MNDNELQTSLSRRSPPANSDDRYPIRDARVARLFLLLTELDVHFAGLESLPQDELEELVSGAILACGFPDVVEAHVVIASVLGTIETPDRQLYS